MRESKQYRPSLQDIAAASGYSPATVSKALNGYREISRQTTELIREKAAAMGYRVPGRERYAPTQERRVVLLSERDAVPGVEAGAFTVSFSRAMAEKGYDCVIPGMRGVREQLQPGEMHAAGACLLCGHKGLFTYAPVLESALPAVTVGSCMEGRSGVCYDCRDAVDRLESYLLGEGYRRTVLICGTGNTQENLLRAFFLQRKKEEGREAPEEDLFVYADAQEDQDGASAVRVQVQRILALQDRPDCILLTDGDLAASAAEEILRSGHRIPEDYSIASLCGAPDARSMPFPSITAILPDSVRMGAAAAEMLTDAMEQPLWYIPRRLDVPGRLAAGSSTRHAGAGQECL